LRGKCEVVGAVASKVRSVRRRYKNLAIVGVVVSEVRSSSMSYFKSEE